MNKIRFSILFFCLLSLILFSNLQNSSAEEVITYERGDTLSFGVCLLQNGTYGDPVSNQVVEFYDQTENVFLGTDITNEQGLASIDWVIPLSHSLGLCTINATYSGNSSLYLYPSVQYFSFSVYSSTKLDISGNESILIPGDFIQLNVSLADDSGNTVPEIPVSVFLEDTLIADSLTNEDGFISFKIECNLDVFSLGINEIRIESQVDTSRFFSSCIEYYSFSINKLATSILSDNFPLSYQLNCTTMFHFQLLSNNIELANFPTLCFIDSDLLGTFITNESGFVNLEIYFDNSFELFNHTLLIVFEGDVRYESTSYELNFNITSPLDSDIVCSHLILNEYANISVRIEDIFNRTVQNLQGHITDLSTNEIYMNIDSLDFLLFKILINGSKGPRDFLLSIRNQYLNENFTFTRNVWSKPSLSLVSSSVNGYASPEQLFRVSCSLRNAKHALGNSVIFVLRNNTIDSFNSTDTNGIASFSISSPTQQGLYLYSFIYRGNASLYELPNCLNLSIRVSRKIPVSVILLDKTTNCAFQQMTLHLSIIGQNGIPASEINLYYTWMQISEKIRSDSTGNIVLILPIPPEQGVYSFYYEVEQDGGYLGRSGSFNLSISIEEALSSQGIGIPSILLTTGSSILILCVPLFRRRYLLN